VATETAAVIRAGLAARSVEAGKMMPLPELDGVHAAPFSPNALAERAAARDFVLTRLRDMRGGAANAVLVVGHQPAIGIVCEDLARTRWRQTIGAIPLAHGAVACITARWRGATLTDVRLRWVITPSDPTTLEHLRAKVASKMQVAGLLAGLVGTALFFVLQDLLSNLGPLDLTKGLQYGAAFALFLAAALNLAAVYAYDVLMMPSRYWAEPRRLVARTQAPGRRVRLPPQWLVWRPPSPDQLVIYQNMMRVWSRLFVPATACIFVGVALMALALVRAPNLEALVPWIAIEAVVAAAVLGYIWAMRPILGVED
jgi:hypothetical protein